MLNNRLCLYLAAVLSALVPVSSFAQSLPQSIPASSVEYIPLFTAKQIAKASKETRKRMQVTEAMNRKAWLERRKASAEAIEAETRAASQPVAPKYTRKGKIYKWVDAQGRIHFGDAPSGNNSQQIKLRNIRPPQGAPAPATAPHLLKNGEDS